MRRLRWISFLPVSVLCGYLAYLLGGTLNNLSIVIFLGRPPRGWIRSAADGMAHMYMGAAFTYVAVKIAPGYPKFVAAGTLGFVLMLAGASIFSSLVIAKYYALPAIIGLVFGGVAVLAATLAGEVGPYPDAGAKKAKGENHGG